VLRLSELAAELQIVLIASLFEKRATGIYHNTAVVLDADGRYLGKYRKMHIPDDPHYYEKFYFTPGDLGYKVFKTKYADIGLLICWDQWFPEAARAMVLQGAEMLFYPTAIGSELHDPDFDSKDHWLIVMRGHAAANIVPVIASNRIGEEQSNGVALQFYGSSFIANHVGAMVEEADRSSQTVLTHTFDLDEIRKYRRDWGVFRDRRPDLYKPLLTLDGQQTSPGI
ncbi:MAG: carbon-nitrogen hydrolase, partial [Hyphomicrobiaceae bacterium]|nr:carbon-nitrogen hydrolase [Hyphomicrobiaceae bacterium]